MSVTETEPAELLCPSCGFDLRGTPGDRCGECGLVIDRAALLTSGFPWAHRREIGRIRAYLKTFWLVTFRSSKLKLETARPQDFGDARGFARVTAAVVSIAFLVFSAIVVWEEGSLKFLDITGELAGSSRLQVSRWLDFELPWSRGAMMWPTLPACMILFAIYLTGVPRSVIARKSFDHARRERAAAISYFTCAPLAMILPVMLLMVFVDATTLGPLDHIYFKRELQVIAGAIAGVMYLLTLILFPLRIGQWTMRINHGGISGAIVAVLQLLALMLIGAMVMFVLLPWCAGFIRIAFSTLR